MGHVEVGGRRLWVERRGEGEPLLCIQGMGGTHLSWGDAFLDALAARGVAPVVFDHRGVGRSDRVDDPFTIADLAGDVTGLLDRLELERVAVLGVSMGGMVAQVLALRHPGRVRTLVLGCTRAGGPGSVPMSATTRQRLFGAMRSGDHELVRRRTYEANLSRRFAAAPGHFEAFHRMATAVRVPAAVIGLQAQASIPHDTSALLPNLDVPTLIVHGDEDEMLDVANALHLAELIPGARLEVLPGVGHMFWWEQPERSAALVAAHVTARAAAAPRSSGSGP